MFKLLDVVEWREDAPYYEDWKDATLHVVVLLLPRDAPSVVYAMVADAEDGSRTDGVNVNYLQLKHELASSSGRIREALRSTLGPKIVLTHHDVSELLRLHDKAAAAIENAVTSGIFAGAAGNVVDDARSLLREMGGDRHV